MNTESPNKEMTCQTVELDPALLAKIEARMAFPRFGDFSVTKPPHKKRAKPAEISEASYQLTSTSVSAPEPRSE